MQSIRYDRVIRSTEVFQTKVRSEREEASLSLEISRSDRSFGEYKIVCSKISVERRPLRNIRLVDAKEAILRITVARFHSITGANLERGRRRSRRRFWIALVDRRDLSYRSRKAKYSLDGYAKARGINYRRTNETFESKDRSLK